MATHHALASFGVRDAKANFTRLVRRAVAGEEIVIMRRGEPIARLVPATRAVTRRLGVDRGVYEVPDDFDAPLRLGPSPLRRDR